ncbi:allophanate hydrolase [Actinoplanes sp. OR16]|uniref:5-oxoprolinase subunit C family protein n=1 Tax=Actinoplanes sp. OR16 TaxID=946334 RepID=UPI000F6C1BB0|nr:biotin-dependent carboxyltransferase family protein [Actinoplanes sp. OR16]BBH65525.1 allophanate hydrolase [Actinoplanes sp. OR16]
MITVLRAGPLTTVQDLGRPGYAHLGVPRSGALDVPALRRANRLVGNPDDAAGLETTLMGCKLRFETAATVAVTGAAATVKLDKEPALGPVVAVPAGGVLEIGRATGGVRSYIAVAGGIAVEPVLGSRSTDTLSDLGPAKLADGMTLPIGSAIISNGAPSDYSRVAPGSGEEIVLGVRLGPRDDWFDVAGLFGTPYKISPLSNRVGARMAGTALTRTKVGELPSEGVVLGSVQVPADGQPIVFLADHPTTGGYPVIGVVGDVTPLAQARPGTTVRFRELH